MLRIPDISVENDTRVFERHPQLCALLVAEEQAPGWRPPPPLDALTLRRNDGRFALWQAPIAERPAAAQ
jgi:hypothetical protein